MIQYDFLVIGSGAAGLRAAVGLAQHGSVALITKSSVGEGSSEHAQGGVAVVLSDEDDIVLHYEDTIVAGDGLCDKNAVMTLVDEGPHYIKELIGWGAKFDMVGDHLDFTREAAHSVNRIIHAHGDATGFEIVRALKEYSTKIKNITFIPDTFVIDLIVNNNEVFGVTVIDENSKEIYPIFSKGVILATGGAGRIFKRTTNPEVATGDGIAIAFRAKATVKDLEFYQFHPTALHLKGAPAFLLSESMRGEGGILRNINKERFCFNYHEKGELAPRDVVSRAIFFEMQKTDAEHVYLDMTHLDCNFVKNRFPKIYNTLKNYGIDITKDLIPVSPAAHYYMGGIETDIWGRTNITGLYACGECACTGVHGANRLASNSLLESVVFGARSAKAAAIDLKNKKVTSFDIPINKYSDCNIDKDKSELQEVMWKNASIVRDENSLNEALNFIDLKLKNTGKNAVCRNCLEYFNMLQVAKLMVIAAKNRKGSRGAHFRKDYPEKIKENWHIVFENGEFNPIIR
ncbi:L-aspartate oxidase [Deferribacter desulfuricans SSM1]|uniref:L-aspartate oxidase n=1 Tax=Deferribacter desulfuricans (strain DSM 14783 / JCM 11476 / NBRC 101012 / SSM1) TaxID=639282 RepID=D3PAT6_DEFDS|nr:L-aspartate oxidase [Deferribacter desulfuricans]BAI79709.1 L-aspartate oxidase [Deferribacter desulfuricans SSM1]